MTDPDRTAPVPATAGAAPAPVRLLAFDTATETLALALVDGPRTFTRLEPGGPRASARLLPAAAELLAEAGLGWRDLQAVAFGAGPGAFTGLRTSAAVAQGLALGCDLPVLALCSLTLVAEDARQQAAEGADDADEGSLAVAMDARMQEVYAARLRWRRTRPADALAGDDADGAIDWALVQPPGLWTLPALADDWQRDPPMAVAGSAIGAFPDALPWPPRQWPHERHRARALAALARSAWRRGEGRPPEAAVPVYLRDKVAQTTAEREAARAVAAARVGPA